MNDTLLIELGTEELPPTALKRLSEAFTRGVAEGLDDAGVAHGAVTPHASPRRLAVSIDAVAARQPDRAEQRRGPALKAAFDDAGEPTKAAQGFARSCGVTVAELGRLKTDQGEWLAFDRTVAGQALGEILGDIVDRALAALPIPKRMRWGAGEVEFVRPAQWLVVLHGDAVLPVEVLGLPAGRTTRGHRFHHGGGLELAHADAYAAQLEREGCVVTGFAARRALILERIAAAGDEVGGEAIIDDALLDEVTALVEWPVVVVGSFDEEFLSLPEEVLIASMQDHQKYFPVRAADGRLVNRFVTIANLDSREPEVVRRGNERVIRPRLADAGFFYRTDRQRPLAERIEGLGGMLFEKRLGSLLDKTRRVERIAAHIAQACGADADTAARAAALSRADLLSEMVGEFPQLQGVMGSYYAAADGEDGAVCTALGEFYRPRFAGDDIPASATGRAVALADRIDSLVGIFGIGNAPTGDRDPFALRRAALGALRILTEGGIDLDLMGLIHFALGCYGDRDLAEDTADAVFEFMRERLRGYYSDRGVPADVCAAVLANDPTMPTEIARRIDAVVEFRAHESAAALAAANKRIGNILRKTETPIPEAWQEALLSEAAEQTLAGELRALAPEVEALFAERNFGAYMQRLATLRECIDGFFDEVMVMSEDAALRDNRLALLAELHGMFTRVADVARLHDS
ncbi:MAG: glycine--tRNA ligase subunit beta [Gammaproteobacteria bacterium]